eukprot:gb/GECG01015529.1/.p1 GENE.gb/GECG01015529.1/~~gb/GECG01015529.1/.p1  ORF type:complete len:143 (+),score=14.89 gb/GECG01015529.1/:1-429(+)
MCSSSHRTVPHRATTSNAKNLPLPPAKNEVLTGWCNHQPSRKMKKAILGFFESNGFRYLMPATMSFIAWASPKMQRNLATYEDPTMIDAKHAVQVYFSGSEKAKLLQVVSPSKEGHIRVLVQALAFSEAASTFRTRKTTPRE